MLRFSFCLLYVFIAATDLVEAQAFRNLSGSNGVTISNTKGIVQDKEGFMWFATYAGLFRYDSHTVKRYVHKSEDSTSISSDMLQDVYCDSRGDIWVGGTGGLDFYNRDTDTFTHIEHDRPNTNPELNKQIYFISEDRDHRIIVGTPFGLNRLIIKNKKAEVTNILHRVFEGPSQDIACAKQTANGDFWVGSYNGLIHVPAKGKPRLFRREALKKSPLPNQFFTLHIDKKGILWLGTKAEGLVQFNPDTEQFTIVSGFRDLNGDLPVVNKITPDKAGNLWLATNSGLAYFDIVKQKSTWFVNQPGDVYSLADNNIQSMCFDNQGGIWLGTTYFGVSYFYPDAAKFTTWPFPGKNYTSAPFAGSWMGVSTDNNVWVIEKDLTKLLLFEQSGKQFSSYDLKLPRSVDYYRFYLDKDGVLWAAGNSVLTSYNLKTKAFTDYPTYVAGEKTLEDGRVHEILEDSRGRFWLVGTFGALLFDRRNGSFKKYKSVSYSQSILEDSKHNIWIGGGDEVFVLRPNDPDFKDVKTDKSRFSANFASVWRLAEDRSGKIWAATRQGLQFFNAKENRFDLEPKVSLEKIEDMQVDRRGFLWLGTDSELTRYNPKNGMMQTYSYQDGLPFNGISRPAASIQDANGALYFSTNKGIYKFSPDDIKTEKVLSPILFTALRILDQEIRAGDSTALLDKNINETTELTFSHNQNIFSLDFALLSYQRSERNRYAYKLEGFDQNWTYTQDPTATYMNLAPGEYTFQVKAANGDGLWMGDLKQLKIRVLPPWWKTWYAYTAYLLLAAMSVYFLMRFFLLRNTLRKDKELQQAKLDFFTNISHEIRTHLSLIIGPLERAFGSIPDDSIAKNQLNYARINSGKLMQLVEELLDFRKIQNGSVKLLVQEYDAVKVLKNVLASFEHLAIEKVIETTLTSSHAEVMLWFDQSQMQKVFYNLLSNAYKFSPKGGKVSVEILASSDEVSIRVADNGLGIAPEHLAHLFQQFFQVNNNTGDQTGYGIGLALSREIVNLHGGNLVVSSRQQKEGSSGETTFTLHLPTGKAHYTESQLATTGSMIPIIVNTALTNIYGSDSNSIAQKKCNLLLIEDNDELRAFEKELFGDDYHVMEAANGVEGLEMAYEHIPDLILCDVMMPELNGIQVCRSIKADIRTSHIPVILLTARGTTSQVLEGLEAGADDYLTKPFDPNVLALKISNILRGREELRRHYNRIILSDSNGKIKVDVNADFISKLRTLVTENISSSEFGVNEMAFLIGMSVSALYKKMRALTGMTVNDFIKTIKMHTARELIESGNYRVKEVAMMVGYDDVRYFSKEFRKTYGKVPSQLSS
ncbi:hybrid sensor histidine kinase/response regulator transcription factor [Dyadobacter sp. CY312]|uniref:hybrid sensor histidine kinase/response regulator transcription factor n=1 Tax=Dyadobacter sp. CY312 TaxID=2907303 RepID=UPI001F482D37|nr:hybrid sensor histidine kinase/response regulator transcription factor [Dyadobacter sp. CY312]MCE7044345.1 response regulator [Dyadobacter sp. CY312]